MTGGYVVTDNLVNVRNNKTITAIAIIKDALDKAASQNVGVKSLLDDYTTLEWGRADALRLNDNKAVCEALEPIKRDAKSKAIRASATGERTVKDSGGLQIKMQMAEYWCKKFIKYVKEGLPTTEEDKEDKQPDLNYLDGPSNTTIDLIEKLRDLIPLDAESAIKDWPVESKPYADVLAKFGKEVLEPPLREKVDELKKKSPHGPEVKMWDALGEEVFIERLIKVTQTAEAFGVNNDKLTPGEQVALFSYTAVDYRTINKYLLKNEGTEDTKTVGTQAHLALAKLDSYVGPSVRGEARFPGIDEQYVVGKEFTVKAFWSSGIGAGFEKEFVVTIDGKTGKDVSGLSNSPNEKEILFAPGTKFKVISRVDKSQHDVKVTVQEV
jgi:hypothetical protein